MKHSTCSRQTVAKSRSGARIIKRSEKGSWTYKCYVSRKQKYFPLGYDKKKALDLADQIRAHLVIYPFEDVLKMFNTKKFEKSKNPSPKILDLEKALYENQISSGMELKTVKGYLDAIKKFARVITETNDVMDFDLGQIDHEMFRLFKSKCLAGITDQAKILERKRTLNSNIRQIKSIFSRMEIFKEFDMKFVDCVKEQEFYRGLKKQYRLPSSELIQKTFDLWHKTSGDVHTLIGMALHFGLRRNEILHLRRSWFDLGSEGDKARVNILAEKNFKPKGGHEGFTKGSKDMAIAILNKASGDDYLIKNRADRGRPAFEAALKELRTIGWDRASPMHELRKLFGSYIASTESLYISQKFLRHADASTTNESYADAIVDDEVKNLWSAA